MKRWKDKLERGSAWLIHVIAWLARTIGRPFCRALLYPIVLYFILTDATARRSSQEFLIAALGRRVRWSDVFTHLHTFAATLLDRVYLAGGQFHRFQISIEGAELVTEALRGGKGCLLLGSHLGPFDLMMLANQTLVEQPLTILMHIDPRSRVRRILGLEDQASRVIALDRPDSLVRAYAALERGGLVAALADRVDGKAPTLMAPFFGQPAAFPLGPHVLAARAAAPVLMCFGLYEGGSRYRIEFTEFGPASDRFGRGAALQPAVDRYAARLEAHARRFPYNWFNFYPYWKAR